MKERRLRFIGHVWRKNNEIAQTLLLREPAKGKRKSGRPKYSYVDKLRDGTGLEKAHLKEIDVKQRGVETSCAIFSSK